MPKTQQQRKTKDDNEDEEEEEVEMNTTKKRASYSSVSEVYYGKENKSKEDILFPLILDYYKNNEYIDVVYRLVHRGQDETLPAKGTRKRKTSASASATQQQQKLQAHVSLRKLDEMVKKKKQQASAARVNLCYFLELPTPMPVQRMANVHECIQYDLAHHLIDLDKTYTPFNLLASYHKMVHHYQQRYFNAFRRRTKIEQRTTAGTKFITSYCQLNFFIWLYCFDILNHLPPVFYGTADEKTNKKKQEEGTCVTNDTVLVYDYPQYVAAPNLRDMEDCILYYPTPETEEALLEHILEIQYTRNLFGLLCRVSDTDSIQYGEEDAQHTR